MAMRGWALGRVVILLACVVLAVPAAYGQFGGGGGRGSLFGAVGGVSIDASGIVRQVDLSTRADIVRQLRAQLAGAGDELGQVVPIRRISLKRLEAAVAEFLQTHPGEVLPESIRYLGGLQSIRYIFVYPQQHDMVIAGPAEGWRVDERGSVVGATTGKPVLQLEDLIVALKYVDQAATEGLSCSIDATAEGFARMQRVLKQQRGRRVNPARLAAAVKQAYGPQTVQVTGVPRTTRMANVLVAADYRMKRIAMELDPAPLSQLDTYFGMLRRQARTSAGSHPRWWMEPKFDSIKRSPDGLAWSISPAQVVVKTENEYFDQQGQVRQTGKQDPVAEQFARTMTRRYDELVQADPLFGELRSMMELAVVAAVIEKHSLLEAARIELPLLTGRDHRMKTERWAAPKSVAPECSIARVRKGWLVVASGGVDIDAWRIAGEVVVAKSLTAQRPDAPAVAENRWWAN